MLLLVVLPLTAQAATPINSSRGLPSQSLSGLYLAVPVGELDAAKLPALEPRGYGFHDVQGAPVLRRSVDHWFFFDIPPLDIAADGRPRYVQIRFPNIDVVSAFVVYSDGSVRDYQLGDDVAHRRWPITTRLPTIPLYETASAAVSGLFLRLDPTGQPAVLPVTVLHEPEFLRQQQIDYLWYGAFFGACLVLVAYNLFLFVSTGVGSYMLYVLYLSAFTLLQAATSGLGQQYLWPTLDRFTTHFALVLIGITNAALLWFVVGFLQQQQRHPRWNALLMGASVVALLLPFLLFLPDYIVAQNTQHIFSIVCMVLIYAFAVVAIREGSRPAVYLLVSYTILFAGVLLALLRYNGLIGTTFVTEHLMELAIVLEALILSLGLADRINDLQQRNRQAAIDARERQARFARELILAHESEKRQFGSALHDHVGHALVRLQYRIRQLQERFGADSPTLNDAVRSLEDDASALHEDIRTLARETHPHLLAQLGLAASLDRLLERALDGHPLQGQLSCDPGRLDDDTELHLYRIVQECVSNTLRHADASEVFVRIDLSDDGFELLYRDDGIGIDSTKTDDAPEDDRGFGLLSIRERCAILGAELSICDGTRSGFCLSVRRSGVRQV